MSSLPSKPQKLPPCEFYDLSSDEEFLNSFDKTTQEYYLNTDENLENCSNYQKIINKSFEFNDLYNVNNIQFIGGFDISFENKNKIKNKNKNENKKDEQQDDIEEKENDDENNISNINPNENKIKKAEEKDEKDESFVRSCGSFCVYDVKSNKIIHEEYLLFNMKSSYKSGYLGFREVPIYIKLFKNFLKNNKNKIKISCIFVDGNGILHQRMAGSATQICYEINKLKLKYLDDNSIVNVCSVGISKTLYSMDGLNKNLIRNEFIQKCNNKGDYILLRGESGIIYGAAVKSCSNTLNPIFVSVGDKISLESCIKLVILTCHYRIPEPIRIADIHSKLYF